MENETKKRGRKLGQVTGPRSVFWVLNSVNGSFEIESSINDDYEKSQRQAVDFFEEKFKVTPTTIHGPYHHFKGMKLSEKTLTPSFDSQDITFLPTKEEIEIDGKKFIGIKGKVNITGKDVMLIEPVDSIGKAQIISL